MLFGIPCEIKIGEQGIIEALKSDHGFASGVNTYQCKPTDPCLAAKMGVTPNSIHLGCSLKLN